MGRLFLLFVLLQGCVSMRGRADDAFATGKYEEAANLYDAVLSGDPHNAEVRSRRDTAREKVIAGRLEATKQLWNEKRDGDALKELNATIAKKRTWGISLAPTTETELSALVSKSTDHVEKAVMSHARAKDLLMAKHRFEEAQGMLSEDAFSTFHSTLRTRLKESSTARCAELLVQGKAVGVYYESLVSLYCRKLETPTGTSPVLPHARARMVAQGAMDGVSLENNAHLRDAVDKWFQKTVWYAPNGAEVADAKVLGSVRVAFSKKQLRLQKPWIEEIPYTAFESYTEPVQEPYTTTEYVTVDVPQTVMVPYSYPCGAKVCTGTRAETRHTTRSEPRTVTRYRTRWETRTRPVTRTRSEPRVFSYDAFEYTGEYESHLSVLIDRGSGVEPFVVRVDEHTSKSGVSHDVSFPPAGISPMHHGLPNSDAYFKIREAELGKAFVMLMNERFRTLYCSEAQYSAESAARCFHGAGRDTPEGAKNMLRTSFASDVEWIVR